MRLDPVPALPGLALCIAIAVMAIVLREASGLAALNPIVLALLCGLGLHAALGPVSALQTGIAIAARPMLRGAIVLLGLQVTLADVLGLGLSALLVAALVVAAAVPASIWLGRALGVPAPMAVLVGVGSGICGASAIVAVSQVVRARAEEVATALAVVTLCGTAGMLVLPLLATPLGLDARSHGLWAGAALHEVVQAVGAAAAGGPEAARQGAVMKLSRVLLLAPVVLILGWWAMRCADRTMGATVVPVPWFAFGFLGMVAAGSAGLVPAVAVRASQQVVPVLLSASIAAVGLATPLAGLRRDSGGAFLLGAGLSIFVAVVALLAIMAAPIG
jgi:uncharacterized integral membrane protein (TIGR00698 family)